MLLKIIYMLTCRVLGAAVLVFTGALVLTAVAVCWGAAT